MRRREGNKEQTILNAAVKVFAETGYHNSKIAKIAEVAGLANGTVYLYYNGKEELLFKMIESLWKKLTVIIQEIADQSGLNPIQKAESMVDAVFDVFTAEPKLSLVVIKEHNQLRKKGLDAALIYYDAILLAFCKIVDEGIRLGQFDAQVDGKLLLHFIFGGLYHSIHLWVKKQKEMSVPAMRQSAKNFIRKGLLLIGDHPCTI